jgi:lipopolysaccharide export LptBFGC system permease protein LptF
MSALLLRASAVPPFALAWTPNVLIFAIGSILLARQTDGISSQQTG